jgi:hypothetical protein
VDDWLREALYSSNFRLNVERIWISTKPVKKSLPGIRFVLQDKVWIAMRSLRDFNSSTITLIVKSSQTFNSDDVLRCCHELLLTIVDECGMTLENK